jgi:hypothetical protein
MITRLHNSNLRNKHLLIFFIFQFLKMRNEQKKK